MQNQIKQLKSEIEKQRGKNVKLFKSIPVPTHEDPSNKKAEPILVEWRKGSKKIKSIINELAELESAANRTSKTNESSKTFVNGFGEATKKYITTDTYERAEKRNKKTIMLLVGGK